MILDLWVPLMVSFALIVGVFIVRRYERDANEFAGAARAFYDAADHIADHRDVPPVVTEFLTFLGSRLRDTGPLLNLFWDIVTGRLRKKIEAARRQRRYWDVMRVRAMVPVRLQTTFDHALRAFFLAALCNSPIIGAVLRRLMLASVTRVEVEQVDVQRDAQALVTEIGDRRLRTA